MSVDELSRPSQPDKGFAAGGGGPRFSMQPERPTAAPDVAAVRSAGERSRSSSGPRRALSKRWLIFTGAASFAFGVMALAPASLLRPAIEKAAPNAQFERLDGFVWRGRVTRLSVDGFDLGEVAFSLNPLSLLTGKIAGFVTIDGAAAKGYGGFAYGLVGGDVTLADVDAKFELASIKRYSMFGIPYQGAMRARITKATWSQSAGCRKAEGEIWTDALSAAARRLAGEGIAFTGPLACDGEDMALRLIGGNAYGEAAISIKVTPQLNYGLQAEVTPARTDTSEGLKAIGFQQNGERLTYEAYGPIRGPSS